MDRTKALQLASNSKDKSLLANPPASGNESENNYSSDANSNMNSEFESPGHGSPGGLPGKTETSTVSVIAKFSPLLSQFLLETDMLADVIHNELFSLCLRYPFQSQQTRNSWVQ